MAAHAINLRNHSHDQIHIFSIKFCLSFALNTLRPRQNGCHFADDIFKCILLNEIVLNFPKFYSHESNCQYGSIGSDNSLAPNRLQTEVGACSVPSHYLNQWWRRLPKHTCITRPQWVMVIHVGTFCNRSDAQHASCVLCQMWCLTH